MRRPPTLGLSRAASSSMRWSPDFRTAQQAQVGRAPLGYRAPAGLCPLSSRTRGAQPWCASGQPLRGSASGGFGQAVPSSYERPHRNRQVDQAALGAPHLLHIFLYFFIIFTTFSNKHLFNRPHLFVCLTNMRSIMGFLPDVKEGPKGFPGLKTYFQTIPIAAQVFLWVFL